MAKEGGTPSAKAFELIAIQFTLTSMYWATPLCQAAERVPAPDLQSCGQRSVEGGTWHLTLAQGPPLFSQHPRDLGSRLAAGTEYREILHTIHLAKIPVTSWF